MTATPGLDDACPHCGKPVGDHTIRGWAECLDAAGFNYTLPYEEVPGGPLMLDNAGDRIMVGAITVKAGAMDSVLGRLPVVMFTFYGPGLEPMSQVPTPEYALVLDANGFRGVKEMVNKNINAAIRAAAQ